jgi:hypothetical protein
VPHKTKKLNRLKLLTNTIHFKKSFLIFVFLISLSGYRHTYSQNPDTLDYFNPSTNHLDTIKKSKLKINSLMPDSKFRIKAGVNLINEVQLGIGYKVSDNLSLDLSGTYIHQLTNSWQYLIAFMDFYTYLQRQVNYSGYRINLNALRMKIEKVSPSLAIEYSNVNSGLFILDACRHGGSSMCQYEEFYQKAQSLGIIIGINRFFGKNNCLNIFYNAGLSFQSIIRDYTLMHSINPATHSPPTNVKSNSIYFESRFGINYYFIGSN